MEKTPMLPGWALKRPIYTQEAVRGWSRVQQAAAFSEGGERLEKALKKYPRRMWGFSTTPKNWCITEVLWHLADQEANLYVRLRRAAAEPGQAVSAYDREKWSAHLLYKKADPSQAKALLLLLRKANADLVKALPAKVWNRKVIHSDWGPMTFGSLVVRNIYHLDGHLAQMGRRYAEWKARGK
jgi:hypothetical protein